MANHCELENRYTVDTYLHSDSKGTSTAVNIVLTEEAFKNNEYETEYLDVHNSALCNCVEPHHPEKLAFMMRTQESSPLTHPLVDLHVLFSPLTEPLNYKLISSTGTAVQIFEIIRYVEWQYLATFRFDEKERKRGYKIQLKIYFPEKNLAEIPAIPAPEHTLSANLLELLSDGKYSDVTLSSKDGKSFNVHKAILEKRSEVFRANFQHNADVNVIKTEIEEDILQQMLTYIYSDKAPKSDDITMELCIAADYYQVLGLKTLCMAGLCKQLKVKNALRTLAFAVQYDCQEMVNFVIRFIKRHQVKVAKTEDWQNLDSIEVLEVLFENGLNK